jgi:predicted nucleic acid-binding protein
VILVDTSVWIDPLRAGDETLAALLDAGKILTHPFVTGELALGSLRQRNLVLSALRDLPQASIATEREVLHFIERHALFGLLIEYTDVHLLAAVRLTAGAALWTRDQRLKSAGERHLVAMLTLD